jgi:hypothetical protein
MWSWPSATEATGQLADVLQSGKVRVAGVKWSKGGAADYKTNPSVPTGFWPQYMQAIADAIGSHYGKTVAVERVYYDDSDLVVQAVADGVVHMSEPYYYMSGFHDDKPRIEALHMSCITVATSSAFSSTAASGITSMDNLYDRIASGPNRKVGFIGAGNYDAVSHILPSNVQPTYITDSSILEEQVDNGTLLASYISESSASSTASRVVYETGVISPRVALFRRDDMKDCVRPSATNASEKDDDGDNKIIFAVVTIILSVVILMLTCLLAVLICKERSGRPVFMTPLKQERPGEAVGNNKF